MASPRRPLSREQRYRRAAAYLESDDVEKALREIDIIEAEDKIARYRSTGGGLSNIVLVCVLTLLTIAFATTARLTTTTITLSIKSDGFQLTGKSWAPLVFEELTIGSAGAHFDELDYFSALPPVGLDIPGHNLLENEPGTVDITSGMTVIDQLTFKPDTGAVEVNLETDGEDLSLFAKNASVWGHLSIKDPRSILLVRNGESRPLLEADNKQRQQDLYFRSSRPATRIIPRYYRFDGLKRLEFSADTLHSLSFSREDKQHRTRVLPTASTGKLQLLDTGRNIEIERGQFLYLECVDCIHNLVQLGDGQIELNLSGKVNNLAGGFEGYIDDYMPNLLEFIYHNEKIAMLWTAVLFVSGWFLKLRMK